MMYTLSNSCCANNLKPSAFVTYSIRSKGVSSNCSISSSTNWDSSSTTTPIGTVVSSCQTSINFITIIVRTMGRISQNTVLFHSVFILINCGGNKCIIVPTSLSQTMSYTQLIG